MGIGINKNPVSRRQFLTLAAGLIALPLLPSCRGKDLSVRIGLHVWPGYEPITLASGLGWLDTRKVDIVATHSATESLELLKKEEIDGAGLTLDEVLRARENGLELAVILVCDISAGADQLLVNASIKSLAALKGCRIGVENGGVGALMLHEVLDAAGLTNNDIHPIALPIDRHAQAWKQGELDAVITYEPAASQIMDMGGKRLFDSSNIPNLITDVLAFRASVLDKPHEDALRNLVAAHLKGLNYLHTHADDASYRLSKRFNLPHDEVFAAFKGLVLPDLDNNMRLLSFPAPRVLETASHVAETLQQAGLLRHKANLGGLLHPEFLPKEESRP